jgi:chloramphenicol O-acetyltransferase
MAFLLWHIMKCNNNIPCFAASFVGLRVGNWEYPRVLFVFCTSLDGRRPANLQTALVTWYASASE